MKNVMIVLALIPVFSSFGENLLDYDFSKGMHGWSSPSYWSGKLKQENGVLQIIPAVTRGKSWARLYSVYARPDKLDNKVLKFTAVLSGTGKAKLGAIFYTKDWRNKDQIQYVWGPEFNLNSTPSEHQYQIDLRDMAPFRIAPCIEVTSEKTASCHKICLEDITATQLPVIRLSPPADKSLIRGPVVYQKTFEHGVDGWRSPSYWGGKLSWDKQGFLQLKATTLNGKNKGGMFALFKSRQSLFGSWFDLSVRVKGRGKIRLGVIAYGIDEKNQKIYPVIWSKETELSESWCKITFTLDLSHRAAVALGLRIELTSAGNVCVDDVSLQQLLDPSIVITPMPEIILLRDKGKAPELSFSISKPAAEAVLFTTSDSNYTAPAEVKPNARGIVKIDRERIEKATRILLSSGGVGSTVFIENLPAGVYDRFDEEAKKINLSNHLNILVIGDSLLDRNFSLNQEKGSMKQVAFWLNQYNPGKFTIRNAAVRGDSIERVWDRMSHELKTRKTPIFEQDVYNGIFKFPADLIFVQLGHNDTVSSSQQGFKSPAVSPKKQEELYRKMLSQFRKVWPNAKIVLVSSTSSNYVLTKNKAEQFLKKNQHKTFMLFGNPAFLEKFNETVSKIAGEFNAEYRDLYTPMKALPHQLKAALLNPNDGVHLSNEGQRYLSFQYLKILADFCHTLAKK